jgi:ribosomal protein L44E
MEERDLFNENDETVTATIYCPKCRTSMEYPIKWRRRTKKASLAPGASEQDRARFAKARNYRIRLDDKLRCKNPRCGKTIEITTLQTVVFD